MGYRLRDLAAKAELLLSESPHFRLRDLAHVLRVERHKIQSAFRLVTGVPFRRYRRQKLLQKAIDLITQRPNLGEKEIATLLGYRSPSAFSRFLRTATGQTFTDIRKEGSKPPPSDTS